MIARDLRSAAKRQHDLIVIGGGIYGAAVALEAARRGWRPLLLERADFGGATSWNSLRILHGGLRYLQTMNLGRFRDSVNERRWFCRTFPELVEPQACLMPIYGEGVRRPLVLGAALVVNDVLACRRNVGVDPAARLPRGRLLGVTETISRFPLVDRRGLDGAALWYDARMLNSQRVLIEMLHWACSLGATALNYVTATSLVRHGPGISAVQARDALDGRTYTFSSTVVCNCAGPWSGVIAERFDRPVPHLFRPSLAFNLLLDCDPPCTAAVAVAPRRPGEAPGPTYFLCPAFGRLAAGTVHVPWHSRSRQPQPTEEQVHGFLSELNAAVPGLELRTGQVLQVFAGLLPVSTDGTANLSVRAVIRNHALEGGPKGLVSVSGVKFTTARLVAEEALMTLAPQLARQPVRGHTARPALAIEPDMADRAPRVFGTDEIAVANRIARDEAVMTIDDLLFRRTNWAMTAPDVDVLRRRVAEAIGWPSNDTAATATDAREEAARGAVS